MYPARHSGNENQEKCVKIKKKKKMPITTRKCDNRNTRKTLADVSF